MSVVPNQFKERFEKLDEEIKETWARIERLLTEEEVI